MTEIVGDPIAPSELILPIKRTNCPLLSGALFISGGAAFVVTETGLETITSS